MDSSSTTLRPRNRRPGSASIDHNINDASLPSTLTLYRKLTSPSTRDISDESTNSQGSRSRTDEGQEISKTLLQTYTSSANFLGASWTSLQGITSTLLGRDLPLVKGKGKVGLPRTREAPPIHTYGIATRGEWGPPLEQETHLAMGFHGDRLAQLQAKKREALLTADGHTRQDSTGTYKRRISVDQTNHAIASEDDEDMLIYLHHVAPGDTLAGVAIKYQCALPAFRKVNRLWPNDSIQIRKTVYLPVEACAIRGRKIAHPNGTFDLLDTVSNDLTNDLATLPTTSNPNPDAIPSLTTSPSITPSHPEEGQWTHDSWVLIDTLPQAVEIARLPRRTVGFFPPRRRKSVTYSDLDPSPKDSRTPLLDAALLSPHRLAPPSRRSIAQTPSGSYFSVSLNGPGGVGSLDHHVRNPGPAPDKLNQLFATHLPALAPRASFDSVHSSSSNGIENVGGAIEGWVRKLASKAAAVGKTPPLRGMSGVGDLIELMEGWELDGGTESSTSHGIARGPRDHEDSLRERFPRHTDTRRKYD